MPTQHGSRFAQVVLLLVVTAAVATALGFLHTPPVNEPPAALILGFYLIGATLGPLLAHLRFLQRSITRHALLDRLVYASVAGLFMLPFALISFDKLHDPQLARVMLAPMAAMLICDWGRRIEIGRLGRVDGGSAFWPAIVGLCTAMFFGASDCALVAAGINAALVLITQGTAALWPAKPAAHRMDILGAGHSALRPAAAPRPEPQAEQAQRVPTDEETAPQEDAASSAPPPPPPIPTVQPSFVGRTAHAGVSFLAKLLLLTGLLLALGQTTFRSHALVAIERGEWQVDNHVATAIERGLPPGIVLGALIVGSFLLIVARRREGAAHFVRGCIGCGFLMWGAIMALTWGGPVLHVFFSSQDWSQLRPGHYMSLTGMGIAFGIAAVLLLWPTARRERPIVI